MNEEQTLKKYKSSIPILKEKLKKKERQEFLELITGYKEEKKILNERYLQLSQTNGLSLSKMKDINRLNQTLSKREMLLSIILKLSKEEDEKYYLMINTIDLVIPLLNRLRTLRKKLNEQEEQRNITRIVP